MTAIVLIGFIYFALTFIIAEDFGRKRAIGYRNSIFWCVLLTPIIGILVVLSSRQIG